MKKSLLFLLLISSVCLLNDCGGGASTPPPATHFSVVPASAAATAGTAFNVTVTALSASGQTATIYSGTVHFSSSDGLAVLPTNSPLANGTGTFSVTLKTPGNQTITATDTSASIAGTSNSITVGAAPTTHFSVTTPAAVTAGSAFNFTVTALDASNAGVTGYSGTVHFTSTDGQANLPNNSMLTNGTAALPATLKSLGAQTITATDTVTASIAGTSSSFNVTAASAARPVPFINQPLSPDAIAPGGAAFKLTVNGTGFASDAIVHWNGNARATTFVSESQLTANILPNDIANSNTASVTVVNPAPSGGTSNVAFFEITRATSFASWSAPSSLATGNSPSSVATADFNGDGKLDMVVVNSISSNISVLLGNGNGTFQAAVNFPAGENPVSVAVGDFNGDGKLDLAVTNANSVSILLGNGDGTFQAPVNYTAGSGATSVAVGDFNGDGKLDMAVANIVSGNVSVLLGNGDGTFRTAVDYGVGSSPTSVAVGDFNGDGKLDLAVANADNVAIGNVSILLGNGDGTFQTAVNYPTEANSASVAVADFNGDGKLDLAVANGGTGNFSVGTVSILLGNGDGTFQAAVHSPTKWKSSFVALGDFNGDGKLDLAVASISSDTTISPSAVSVLIGNGDGTFQSAMHHAAGIKPWSIAVGDFNDDGRLDLAVADVAGSAVSLLLYPVLAGSNATLSTTILDFGTQLVGTTSLGSNVILSNDGTATLNITSIVATANFSDTDNCDSSLGAGSSCTITVNFVPLADGKLTGTLSITDNAPGSPQTVTLNGVGTIVKLVPDALFFSCTGFCQSQNATLTNTGAAALSINNISITSNKQGGNGQAGFAQMNNCPASLPTGQSCTITVSFIGNFNFKYFGALIVQDSDGTQQVSLHGFLNP